jgi:hypothetical protein
METPMIFTKESIVPQLELLLNKYPDLVVEKFESHLVHLHGHILVFRIHNDFPVRKEYFLDIFIPICSDELPYVIDSEKQIRQDYLHYYSNGKLCLSTDSQIRIRFIEGFDLVAWIFEFVEVYYYSYEYYERFKVYPFGERSHGSIGIIQTYQDLLMARDEAEAYKLMHFIKDQKYHGHHQCPCGSGKILRKCHGQAVLRFFKDARIKKIMIDDLDAFDRKLAEHEHNRKKTK